MTGPKVFITQEKRGFDYSEALEFGEVVFLSRDEYLPLPTMGGRNEEIWDRMFDLLDDYKSGFDFVLLSGSPVSMFMAGAMMLNGTGHKILKWDNHRKKYSVTLV